MAVSRGYLTVGKASGLLRVSQSAIITLGFFSLLNKEITLTVIAALLTLVGYSMNDTIDFGFRRTGWARGPGGIVRVLQNGK